ncbi:hypothetical protein Q8W71_02950 [Methylobacterium sp. NEAU 140]|uniref:hypothetical protein n=1 Tax=Methylobacterium sp. NEAU 140 TaxID=3064945 RepID=UPI002732DF22|nr:hypothetical protein [Methylobacterium sp. NEAU 140]MDP4021569.1 hypothetical protein [Methylobacterium sp. NEAU 140]
MHSEKPDTDATPELVAEMRTVVDETRRAIEATQAILDRCADAAPAPELGLASPELLDEIGDGLIHAYSFAKQDGDPLTITLIEKALFHVGRRLARGMTPAEAGLVCH